MEDNKELLNRTRYSGVQDHKGNPVNVPGWMLEAWLKTQGELEAKAAKGESTEPDPKILEKMFEGMEKDLEDL